MGRKAREGLYVFLYQVLDIFFCFVSDEEDGDEDLWCLLVSSLS